MRNLREYHRPETLDDALGILARDTVRAVPLAGGTELVAAPRPTIDAVVDLSEVGLDELELSDGELRMGGLVRLSTLAGAPEVRGFAGGMVSQAARLTATSLLRNQGTLAGALLTRLANSELPPVLLALDATVTIRRKSGTENLSLGALYENLKTHTDRSIITEVHVPAPPAEVRIYRDRVARTPADRPIMTVTALTRVDVGMFTEVRIAASGTGAYPRRLTSIETALLDTEAEADAVRTTVTPLVDGLSLPSDPLASSDYRRAVLPVLIRRAILGK